MTDAPLRLAQSDFTIPAPQGAAPRQGEAPGGAPAPATPPIATPLPPSAPSTTLGLPFALPRAVTTGELVAGGLVYVVLLAVFLAVKVSVTRGLQARYAAPGPASEAGWLLFAFLAFASLVLIAAFLGSLWTVYVLVGPAALIALLLLVLFLRKRAVALRTRR